MNQKINAFQEAMRTAGLEPPPNIEPGEKLHRFPGIGKGPENNAGWCRMFSDGMGGVYGDWSSNLRESWQAEQAQSYSPIEHAAFRQKIKEATEQAEADRKAAQQSAAGLALKRWQAATPAHEDHPYLKKKEIKPHGIKQEGTNLLLPLYDEQGKLWTLQTISPNGNKRFTPKGGRTKGLFFSIGEKPLKCVVEGFATGAAVYEATRYSVVIAFNADNIKAVLPHIKSSGSAPLVICADDDQQQGTDQNPGIKAAEEAAAAGDCVVAYPAMGKKADFWDLFHETGPAAVKVAIDGGITPREKKLNHLMARASVNCGAPFEEESLHLLSALKEEDAPSFMRFRQDLKKNNPSILLQELDKKIPPPAPPMRDFEKSSQSSLPRLVHKTERGPKLLPQSRASSLLAKGLNGQYKFSIDSSTWYRFEQTQWVKIKLIEFETAVIEALTEGTGTFGFTENFQRGVTNLIQKGGFLTSSVQQRGTVPFQNGQLNIKDRTLYPTTPRNALTWCLSFEYNTGATCPNFTEWIGKAVDGDKNTIQLIRAYINAIIIGRPDLQRFLHLVGPGGTGKSTLGRLLFDIVGEENRTTTSLKQLEGNRFETAGIYGKKLVCIEEAESFTASVSVLKAMTGQDPLRLERKGQQQEGTFIYEGQVLLMSNERFTTKDSLGGIERRRITIDFLHKFTAEERADWDRRGGEKALLFSEIPGIINWSLELSHNDVTEIFKELPGRVQRSNFEAMIYTNPLAEWMIESCVLCPDAQVQIGRKPPSDDDMSRLYPNYYSWAEGMGVKPIGVRSFSTKFLETAKELGATNISKKRVGGSGKGYAAIFGLKLKKDNEPSWKDQITVPVRSDTSPGEQIFPPAPPASDESEASEVLLHSPLYNYSMEGGTPKEKRQKELDYEYEYNITV